MFAGAIGVLLLLSAAHADPAVDKPMPNSNEEAIAMTKQECAAALARLGPDGENLRWQVTQTGGRWLVVAGIGTFGLSMFFPKVGHCRAGWAVE